MEQMLLDGLSSCYEFVFYFYLKPPIFFFFFSCFCFSHPKHQNPTELNWNQLQSVGFVFIHFKLVDVEYVKTKFHGSVQKLTPTLIEPNWLHPYMLEQIYIREVCGI